MYMRVAPTLAAVLILVCAASHTSTAANSPVEVEDKTSSSFAHDNPNYGALWDGIVSKYVSLGEKSGIPLHTVDYAGIAKDKDLSKVLDNIADFKADKLSKNESYAFYINVYNALAVNTIVENMCTPDMFGRCSALQSIRDVGNFIRSVWKMPAGVVAGTTMSLDDVEDLLRFPKEYKLDFSEDPRLHSAIVCASISCPNLRNSSFTPALIDEQLSEQMRNFLSNKKKGLSFDSKSKTVTLSPIFDWYKDDFTKYTGTNTVIDFILPYVPADVHDDLKTLNSQNQLQFAYFDYNWNVNGEVDCDKTRPCFPLYAGLAVLGGLFFCSLSAIGWKYCCKKTTPEPYIPLE